jgi:hypothetical protein
MLLRFLAAGITLQSGLVVDLQQLQQQYQGQCCLPRSVLNDNSALLRIDNSDGRFFVSMDPSCSTPLTSDVYPAMFEYISVGCTTSSSSGGTTYVINGGELGENRHWISQPLAMLGQLAARSPAVTLVMAIDAVHWLQHVSSVEQLQLQGLHQGPPRPADLLLLLLLCRPHNHFLWRQHL